MSNFYLPPPPHLLDHFVEIFLRDFLTDFGVRLTFRQSFRRAFFGPNQCVLTFFPKAGMLLATADQLDEFLCQAHELKPNHLLFSPNEATPPAEAAQAWIQIRCPKKGHELRKIRCALAWRHAGPPPMCSEESCFSPKTESESCVLRITIPKSFCQNWNSRQSDYVRRVLREAVGTWTSLACMDGMCWSLIMLARHAVYLERLAKDRGASPVHPQEHEEDDRQYFARVHEMTGNDDPCFMLVLNPGRSSLKLSMLQHVAWPSIPAVRQWLCQLQGYVEPPQKGFVHWS